MSTAHVIDLRTAINDHRYYARILAEYLLREVRGWEALSLDNFFCDVQIYFEQDIAAGREFWWTFHRPSGMSRRFYYDPEEPCYRVLFIPGDGKSSFDRIEVEKLHFQEGS